jgi:transcriptional regulator with XRE-family HTH domain
MDEPKPMRELTRIREERGLSQQGLADASGVNKATINQIERGRRSPNLETLEKLAGALAVEVADFFPKAQAPLPEMQEYGALLEERGFPSEQIAARLAEDEAEKEFIARELEKASRKDLLELVMGISPALRRYYRENQPQTDAPPRSESA